jgi:hypothetical protein
MNDIYERYRDRVDFYLVYIQEAHPTDGWLTLSNIEQEVLYAQPKTADERAAIAGICMLDLGFNMPMLLDNMDDEVDRKYAALPERLYVLDKDGIIAYRGVMGSRGFDVETWQEAIQTQWANNGSPLL